ncbi:antibiotic biosynthesis monooxygenase family protein [Acidisphaera rubrifaciens]|uniref:Antibiotic biosynthesis monooxygenase n=1 Tax=Acidisphaera rubrifaciens HS-AP3 TaxID=1231350 RepID=A0A0D6PBP6_9PROT|nr:antibiotic biosynthesis monooxygenase [Acidisphaera rubrifaciens]GAN78284.1 antibiotic biosynthesis monooxygenase [Acidisphaera rubrifaciens HS-AP3]
MFCVIFEVQPRPDRWDAYLGHAAMLRPELLRIDGFIDNVRYRSRREPGRLLSLSTWRDEKALVRWRTHALHHDVQAEGRASVFRHYHLRVGQVTADTHVPDGHALREQRLDTTEVGLGVAVTIVQAHDPAAGDDLAPNEVAARLGLDQPDRAVPGAPVAWDVFDAILTPGDRLALATWTDAPGAWTRFPAGARRREVRIVRDYGLIDRREAPQYFPPVGP